MVGYYSDAGTFKTLAMHWNGTAWTITPTANPAAGANQLKKVVAIAANDVWSIGGHGQSYTMRWNGSAWAQVPLPPITSQGSSGVTNYLEDIAAVSSNDIWMVGAVDSMDGKTATLTMHWDGAQWTQIPSPNVPDAGRGNASQGLESVVALAPNNVWAAGQYRSGATMRTLIMHWDGAQWSIVPTPNGPSGNGWLHGIAAASANDIWAVGEYSSTAKEAVAAARSLALHWDGVSWTAFAPPNPSVTGVNPLQSVVARGPNDFYAVGSSETVADGLNTFVARWDGTQWTQSASENPNGDGSGWNPLLDVGRDAQGELWAVGKKQTDFASANYTLVQRADPAPTALTATGVVSRKVHGSAGTFDINLPAEGPIGVESRLPTNGEYTLVFSFSSEVTAVDVTKVGSGVGSVSSAQVGPNPNEYTLRLTGVADLQHLVVSLEGVHGVGDLLLASAVARMDVVVGDANGSRAVNSSDVGIVKANVGAVLTTTNFRADVTGNGSINSSDVSVTKSRSGSGL